MSTKDAIMKIESPNRNIESDKRNFLSEDDFLLIRFLAIRYIAIKLSTAAKVCSDIVKSVKRTACEMWRITMIKNKVKFVINIKRKSCFFLPEKTDIK